MLKKLAVIALVIVASLLVAGCTTNTSSSSTPTPTPTPTSTSTSTSNLDYSSYYQKLWEGSGMIVERTFTKSTNVRGNDVYLGIMRNATLSQGTGVTTVMELTKSKNESTQLYDKYVSDKLAADFTPRSDWIAQFKASDTGNYTNIWIGQSGSQQFYVMYRYNPDVSSWELTTEAS
jgi:hypothetical protein